jgi:hypothetical protein
MWTRIIAAVLCVAFPASTSAGPLRDAAEKAARELAAAQETQREPGRSRMWTGIALIVGGGVLTALGAAEVFDDEDGPDDLEDTDDLEDADDSDDGEDSDWGNSVLVGGGIAAAALGGYVVWTGQRASASRVTLQPGRILLRHTVRF